MTFAAKYSAMVHILFDIVFLLKGEVINFVADSHQKLRTSSPHKLEQYLFQRVWILFSCAIHCTTGYSDGKF